MAARRREKAGLLPQPVPQAPGQLPLFAHDGTAWWTARPAGEVDEAGGDQGPWGGDGASSVAGEEGGGK
jgi:hypothetical protein